MNKILLVAAFVLGLSIQASATTYYVTTKGSDSRNGTSPSTAWRTINRVNSADFEPGDQINFRGGQNFSGNLYFTSSKAGTADNPVTITSYGGGRARINAGNGWGLYVYNTAGLDVININFVGSGRTVNSGDGIAFYSDQSFKHAGIRIDQVDASGFGGAGVLIASDAGFRDIQVTNSILHDNIKAGLMSWAAGRDVHENFYVYNVTAHGNTGKAGPTNDGSGIVLYGVNGGTIEYCTAYNNGAECEGGACGGCCAVGIWVINSTGITVQYNESRDNKTNSAYDGGGFDLDNSTRNSLMQYNVSRNNEGPGYMLCCNDAANHHGNTIRYNTSENDGKKNGGGISIHGTVSADIYGNTIIVALAGSGTPPAVIAATGTDVWVRNNHLTAHSGLPHVYIYNNGGGGLFFFGNQYNEAFHVITPWGTYTSKEQWRQAEGQEPY